MRRATPLLLACCFLCLTGCEERASETASAIESKETAAGVATPASAPAEPDPATSATEAPAERDIDTWHTYYYQDPDPSRLGEYMLELADRKHFRDFDRAYATGAFVALILEVNPELAWPIAESLREVEFRQRWGFYYGLWLSGIGESFDILQAEGELRENPAEANQLLAFVGATPFELLGVEDVSARTIDMLWESFYASGDEAYALKTMTMLPDAAVPNRSEDHRRLTGAVRSVLADQCFRHKAIMDLCERVGASEEFTPGIRASVRDAVATARTRLERLGGSPDPGWR